MGKVPTLLPLAPLKLWQGGPENVSLVQTLVKQKRLTTSHNFDLAATRELIVGDASQRTWIPPSIHIYCLLEDLVNVLAHDIGFGMIQANKVRSILTALRTNWSSPKSLSSGCRSFNCPLRGKEPRFV
jgi:hypothetical protein